MERCLRNALKAAAPVGSTSAWAEVTASGAERLYAEQDFVRSAALGCIKVPSGASKSEIPVEAHVVGAPSRQGIHIIRRQRLLPSTGRNPLCGSADRYFFLPTSTNTMRMWRTNALTPASRNNTIGFICQVSVSSRTMALRFYQHPLAGGSPGRSRLRRRPRTWGPTERAREGGQGRQARCRGGSGPRTRRYLFSLAAVARMPASRPVIIASASVMIRSTSS